jgi:hypothetical protein
MWKSEGNPYRFKDAVTEKQQFSKSNNLMVPYNFIIFVQTFIMIAIIIIIIIIMTIEVPPLDPKRQATIVWRWIYSHSWVNNT